MRTNNLKIQKNILKVLSILFTFSLTCSDTVLADTSKKRASGKSRVSKGKNSRSGKIRNSVNKNNSTKKDERTSQQTNSTEATGTEKNKTSAIKKDTTGITRYNCESSYFKCMNQFCYSPKNGRCSCKDETKFNTSNEQCSYILSVCPSKSNDILDNYKKGTSTDCSSFVMKTESEKVISPTNALAELTDCMRKNCKANRQYDFLACFDADNFEKGMNKCKKTYQDVKDKQVVEDMFKESMLTYKQKYCDDIDGTIQNDGECHLKIGFGPSYKDIKAVKDFKVGDKVICSESGFNASLGESKVQKIRYIKEIALFGIDVVKTGVSVASIIVGNQATKQELQAQAKEASDKAKELSSNLEKMKETGASQKSLDYIQGQANELNSKAQVLNMVADSQKTSVALTSMEALQGILGTQHLAGAVGGVMGLKMTDFSYDGYCFIIKGTKRKPLFEANDDFYYKVRWTPQWTENMLTDEDEEL